MKKLRKLDLKDEKIANFHDAKVLINSEMKNLWGGSYEHPTKIEACEGKNLYDYCYFDYYWNGEWVTDYPGRCLQHAPNYTLHCSDLW